MEAEALNELLSPVYSETDQPVERAELDALERVVGDTTAKAIRLSLSLLRQITEDFSNERKIGSGGFAEVYLGVLPNGSRIAVKRLHHLFSENDEFIKEVSTMMTVAHHENIVRLIGYCSEIQIVHVEYEGKMVTAERREDCICFEYVPNGSLRKHISDEFSGELDWNQRYQILKGICQALHYIHNTVYIVHGDLKPDNILLEDNLVPKIIDFGTSRCFGREGESLIITNMHFGTMGYLAPEDIEIGCWSIKSDIYSIGVCIMMLLFGRSIYQQSAEQSFEQILKQLRKKLVKEGTFSSWENKYQQVRTCLELCYNCMDRDPDKRPTAFEIIQLLEETESTNYSGVGGNAPSVWLQSGDEESDTDNIEQDPESTAELPPSDDEEELTDLDTTAETSTQEDDEPDTVRQLPASADLSKLKFLEEITDHFSHKRIVGKDGTYIDGSHKVFVYKGNVPRRKMIAVKRFIGVGIPVDRFRTEAEQFKSLDHKNIVKVLSYCHDESGKHRLVHFKGQERPKLFSGPEQLLCYEYMHNGSLQEYLIGKGSREIDWDMRYKLIKGMCKGLRYLHKGRGDGPIVHLNLNPSNVLLDENNTPCITGFDFSKLIGEKDNKTIAARRDGQISYLPSDFFYSRGTDLKYLSTVDIYSLGLMILEITTRQEHKADHETFIQIIEENWREESQIETLYTSLGGKLCQVKLCIDVGLDCVKPNHARRPTAKEITIWLEKGSKPIRVPVQRPRVPPRPVHTNNTHAAGGIPGKEKRMGLLERLGFGRK
uniref:Uncharacterized protein n=1 Tax=Avena sativa TaxID=4498 RepID=A0ACD5TYA5_AVESA